MENKGGGRTDIFFCNYNKFGSITPRGRGALTSFGVFIGLRREVSWYNLMMRATAGYPARFSEPVCIFNMAGGRAGRRRPRARAQDGARQAGTAAFAVVWQEHLVTQLIAGTDQTCSLKYDFSRWVTWWSVALCMMSGLWAIMKDLFQSSPLSPHAKWRPTRSCGDAQMYKLHTMTHFSSSGIWHLLNT